MGNNQPNGFEAQGENANVHVLTIIPAESEAIEALPALWLTYSGENRAVSRANEYARRTLGFSVGDRYELSKILHCSDGERLELAELSARDAHSPALTEIRMRGADGNNLWLQCSIGEGRGNEFIMTAHIVDTLKLAERNLAQSHDALQTITQNVDCAIFTVAVENNSLTLVYANDAFYNMLGFSPSELGPGREGLDEIVFCVDDRARFMECISRGAQEGSFEGRLKRRGGAHFWVTMRSRELVNADGDKHFICTYQDIDHLKEIEQELQLSNSRYELLLGNSGGLFYEIDLENDTLFRSMQSESEWPELRLLEDVPGSLISSGIVFAEHREALFEAYSSIKNGAEKQMLTIRCRRASGEDLWAEVSAFCIYSQHNNKPVRALVIMRDVTRQYELEMRFKSEEQYREAMTSSSIAILKFSLVSEKIISYILNGTESIEHGMSMLYSTVLTNTAHELVHPHDRQEMAEFYSARRIAHEHSRRGVRGDCFDFRMRINKTSPYFWVRGTLNVLAAPDSGELICFSYIVDISKQKEKELDLLRKAEIDSLTGIFNRAAIKTRVDGFLTHNVSPGKLHALIMLDLDGFKLVNDGYGHEIGDAVLHELGAKLLQTSRTSDHVARLGGDEFVVFLKDAKSIENITNKAQKICEMCSALHINGEVASFLSASVGIAVAPRDGTNFDELYRRADKAMYLSKELGKNCISFYSAVAEGCIP